MGLLNVYIGLEVNVHVFHVGFIQLLIERAEFIKFIGWHIEDIAVS